MCKKISVLTILLFALASLTAQAQESMSIEAFGEEGAAVPEVARTLLSKDFFSRNMTESLADVDSFTASFEIPKQISISGHKLGTTESYTKRIPARATELTLHFENRAWRANDIVVSAMANTGGKVRNFLVRVESGGTLSLNAASLADFDRLHFVSLQDFSVNVDSRLNRGAAKNLELDVRQALTKSSIPSCENATAYCSECNESIEICAVGGGCVFAYAKRRFDHTTAGHTWYSVDIYYPSSSDLFHEYTSGLQDGAEPVCRTTVHKTRRTNGSTFKHKWTGLDKTLFDGDQSTAACTDGCVGSFTVDRL